MTVGGVKLRGEILRPRGGIVDQRWLWALVRLERRCYSPGDAYSPRMLATWLSDPAVIFLGLWQGQRLAAAQISDLAAGHLITLDVHPDFQRRGLGRRLLRLTLALQRRWGGQSRVRCEIATDNVPSLRLHEQEGFRVAGLLPSYYRDGRDAFLLTRSL